MINPQTPAPDAASAASRPPPAVRRLFRTIRRLKIIAGTASIVAALALAGMVLTYQRFSTLRPIALVGGEAITRRDYEDAMEQKYGKEVLTDLVSAALVRQAAASSGLLPTDDYVDARLALVRQHDPGLVSQAEAAGTLPALREQLRAQIALENLRIENVSVTDTEVARYYAAHRASFQQAAEDRMNLVTAQTARQAKMAARELRGGALDTLAKQPGLHVVGRHGYQVNLATPQGRALTQSWNAMHTGEVRTEPLGGQFLVVQMVSAQPARVVPLGSIQADVTRLAKLDKAISAQAEIARLYQANPPSFPVEKYAAFFNGSASGVGQ